MQSQVRPDAKAMGIKCFSGALSPLGKFRASHPSDLWNLSHGRAQLEPTGSLLTGLRATQCRQLSWGRGSAPTQERKSSLLLLL